MFATLHNDIEKYLQPQERFETLRQHTTLRFGPRLCDFSYANSYDGPNTSVIAAIRKSLDSRRALDMQYTPYGGSTQTRRMVAQKLSESHGCRFNWRNVVLTPGAMAALNVLFRAVRHDGEANEIIVITPCWLDYPLYLANLGIKPVFVPMSEDMCGLDLDRIADALRPTTRAIVITQPANPAGTLISREQLLELGELLEASESRPLLISDECHRDVVFEPNRFFSPIECYDNTCVVYSFGKSLFMQGQRLGYAAVSPRADGAAAWSVHLERLCRTMGFCTPTALMQLAVRSLLGERPDLSPIERRRERTIQLLGEAGYRIVPSQATFFLYVSSPDLDDFAFAEALADRGVLVLPSSIFHHSGHFRVSFTASDEMVDRALPIFAEVRQKYEAQPESMTA